MKIRILIITVRADFGGGPEHIRQLMENSPDTIEYFVACPEEKPYYRRFQSLTGRKRLVVIAHRRFDLKAFFRVYRFATANSIELIHSHGKGAGIYARPLAALLRIPCIHTFHGLHTGTFGAIRRMLYLGLERFLSTFTDIVISVSKGEAANLVANRAVPGKKIRLVPNGVFIPSRNHYHYHDIIVRQTPVKISAVSRFDYQKNPELIVEIALHLKQLDKDFDFVIEILGTGENFNAMQRLVEQKGLADRIRLVGAVDAPRAYFQQAFCFLSTSRWEGMPLALLEAMSEGVPVVATRVVGNNDVITDKVNGLLYDPDAPQKAAQLILGLADDENPRTRLSRNGYDSVSKNHDVKTMAEKTVALYQKMVQS